VLAGCSRSEPTAASHDGARVAAVDAGDFAPTPAFRNLGKRGDSLL
jgi:hypothetical protein